MGVKKKKRRKRKDKMSTDNNQQKKKNINASIPTCYRARIIVSTFFLSSFFFSFSRLFISKTREYVFTLLIFNDILFIHEQPHECTEMRICINNNKKKIR